MARGRVNGFIDSHQKDGGFCPHLDAGVTSRLIRYCKATNQNKTRFVENCIEAQLDILEKEVLASYTKEQLIEMILQGRS